MAGEPSKWVSMELLHPVSALLRLRSQPQSLGDIRGLSGDADQRLLQRLSLLSGPASALLGASASQVVSLFETWRVQGENALESCRQMLIASQKPAVTPVA